MKKVEDSSNQFGFSTKNYETYLYPETLSTRLWGITSKSKSPEDFSHWINLLHSFHADMLTSFKEKSFAGLNLVEKGFQLNRLEYSIIIFELMSYLGKEVELLDILKKDYQCGEVKSLKDCLGESVDNFKKGNAPTISSRLLTVLAYTKTNKGDFYNQLIESFADLEKTNNLGQSFNRDSYSAGTMADYAKELYLGLFSANTVDYSLFKYYSSYLFSSPARLKQTVEKEKKEI